MLRGVTLTLHNEATESDKLGLALKLQTTLMKWTIEKNIVCT